MRLMKFLKAGVQGPVRFRGGQASQVGYGSSQFCYAYCCGATVSPSNMGGGQVFRMEPRVRGAGGFWFDALFRRFTFAFEASLSQ